MTKFGSGSEKRKGKRRARCGKQKITPEREWEILNIGVGQQVCTLVTEDQRGKSTRLAGYIHVYWD
jgi:hypothetical protein